MKKLGSFKNDKRGFIVTWIIVLICLLVFMFLMLSVAPLLTALFTGPAVAGITNPVVRDTIASWMTNCIIASIVLFLGLILYGIVRSTRREDVTYQEI